MKNLPPEIKILRSIKERLDELMLDRELRIEIRSNRLYNYVIKDEHLKEIFPEGIDFNRFLRSQHQKGILKQIIPNCRVDISNFKRYEWYFFRDVYKNIEDGKGSRGVSSKLVYKQDELKIFSSDGKKFRSNQEREIYEQLLKCNYLIIECESPISKYGEKKYADFKITNQQNNKTYFWEHFGMTNSSKYLNAMTEKIKWYRENGFRIVEDGGDLIYTYFSDLKKFQRDIDRYINLIRH